MFFHDRKTQYAVIRALQILAELTQRLSPELKAGYPEIDWRSIAGLSSPTQIILSIYAGYLFMALYDHLRHQSELKSGQ